MKKLILTLILLTSVFILPTKAQAASGKIEVSPAARTSSVGQNFSVSVNLNGGGTSFSSARGSISISPLLTITDLILGNCGFSFVISPTIEKPSFAGGILGGSTKECTVFTLIVKAKAVGEATIKINNGSIISSKDFAQLLSSVQYGSYLISNNTTVKAIEIPPISLTPAPASTLRSRTATSSIQSYDVQIKTLDSEGNPIVGATIASSDGTVVVSDNRGITTFNDLKRGVYNFIVKNGTSPPTEEVIGISGENPQLSFAIREGTTTSSLLPEKKMDSYSLKPQFNNFYIIVGLVIVGLVIAEISLVAFLRRGQKVE